MADRHRPRVSDGRLLGREQASGREVAAGVYREFHGRFLQVAAGLGFDPKSAELQWWAVAKVAALAGVSPERLTKAQLDTGREQLIAATHRLYPDHPMRARPVTTRLHGVEATLFHAGVIDVPPRKRHWNKSADRAREWAAIPPRLRTTFEGYIEQMRLSLRPATMVRVEAVLREFASWLTTQAPEVAAVRDLRRPHIERYKRHLAQRPSVRGGRLSNIGLAEQLGTLRVCLDRLSEWDGEDAPTRVLMFAGDIPRRDQPLPRFIDDAAAAKLLRAAREHPDPFTRLAVEFLARTGLRKSEFLDLTVDSVVQIGAAYWLHVPLGKLRTDRYIPCTPAQRDARRVGRRASRGSARAIPVHRAWPTDRQATRRGRGQQRRYNAGIGRVTPHQLRHTLATQAINRGMSLEAIAARFLGHRSMRMTMVYAKIANRTVADEYFSARESRSALRRPQGTTRHRRGGRDAQAPLRDAPTDARQRLLRPPRRAGLPLRIDLRIVHLLPDHARVQTNARTSTRRRR